MLILQAPEDSMQLLKKTLQIMKIMIMTISGIDLNCTEEAKITEEIQLFMF